MAEDAYTIRHELALAFRRRRLELGWTQSDLAQRTTWSTAKVNRYESGERPPILADLLLVLPMLGYTDDEIGAFLDLARKARATSYHAFSDILSRNQVAYFEALSNAEVIQEYCAYVPLMLRTDAYCDCMDAADKSASVLERWRMLNDLVRTVRESETRSMTFVVDEAALWRRVGGVEVMHEQLSYLWILNRRKHITIRILPFEAGMFAAMVENYTLFTPTMEGLTFGTGRSHPEPIRLVRDPAKVAILQAAYDQVLAASVTLEALLPDAFQRLAA